MLKTTFVKRIAIVGCLVLMAALIPVIAFAANPVWVKIAEKGITDPANRHLLPGVQFNGKLMIGSDDTLTASMYAYDGTFAQVGSSGFGDVGNKILFPYAVYQNMLYIGTGNTVSGGQLWKWSGTGNPAQITGVPWTGASNSSVYPLGVFNNKLIVCIGNSVSGLSMYSFDGTSWTQLTGQGSPGTSTGPGFGDQDNLAIPQFPEVIYNGRMILPVTNNNDGLQVYAYDGSSFTRIGQAGAGSWDTSQESGLAAISQVDGLLYLGTGSTGAGQLWSYNGSVWSQLSTTGISASSINLMPIVRGEELYVSTKDTTTGCRVYRRAGGSFEAMSDPGLGDTNNQVAVLTSYNGSPFALTGNDNGGQAYVTPIPPSIDQVIPNSGPYGTTITIEGHDFGVTQGSGGAASTVTVYDKNAEVVSWSDTSIQAIVPTRATTGAVQVQMSTGDSNQVTFTLTLSRTWYFAEGTTRDNAQDGRYEEWICLQNPGSTDAKVHITYMLADGSTPIQDVVVGKKSRSTISVNDEIGKDKDVSTFVESDQLILAERPMYFNYRNKWTGGHEVMGVPVPRNYYYFAEGTTRSNAVDGYFEEWLCFQNPQSSDAVVNVNYVLGTGKTVQKMYSVKARSRYTVDVNTEVGADQDVSCVVNSSQGIVAERPMYFFYHNKWTGGHDVVGAPGPGTEFYFAEGTTRDNARDGSFEEWISLQNSTIYNAPVKITYYTEQSGTVTQEVLVGPTSRLTVDVNLKLGKDVDASCKVESTAGIPILAERPMYFNYHNEWDGGHDVMGCDAAKKSFYFAEGTTRAGFATWIAVMNPGAEDVTVTFHYLLGTGENIDKTVVVAANKRYTRDVLADVGAEQDISIVVEGNTEIVAERPMYFNYHGWCTGGHDTLGYGI